MYSLFFQFDLLLRISACNSSAIFDPFEVVRTTNVWFEVHDDFRLLVIVLVVAKKGRMPDVS